MRRISSFSSEDLERYHETYLAARETFEALAAVYAAENFRDETARTFATHGFPCRRELMVHCMERAMEAFPPRIRWIPSADGILDATVCLQVFVTNVHGCIDNLAHIPVREKGLTGDDGTPLPDSRVGLRPANGAVLDSLSSEFAGRLKELGPWFEYLEDFRHALEHRVPLYVARNSVPEDRLRQYGEIGERILEAEMREDHAEADRLTNEQNRLVSFFPVTAQAFGENSGKAVFHFQMASDFSIVEEIARRLLRELDCAYLTYHRCTSGDGSGSV